MRFRRKQIFIKYLATSLIVTQTVCRPMLAYGNITSVTLLT